MVEKRKKRVSVIEIAYFPLGGSFCFIPKFILDFRKDNLMILGDKIFLSLARTSSSLSRINVFEAY